MGRTTVHTKRHAARSTELIPFQAERPHRAPNRFCAQAVSMHDFLEGRLNTGWRQLMHASELRPLLRRLAIARVHALRSWESHIKDQCALHLIDDMNRQPDSDHMPLHSTYRASHACMHARTQPVLTAQHARSWRESLPLLSLPSSPIAEANVTTRSCPRCVPRRSLHGTLVQSSKDKLAGGRKGHSSYCHCRTADKLPTMPRLHNQR